MTLSKVVASLLVAVFAWAVPCDADGPEAAQTTTDLGLTVSAEQVLDSMLEMDGFWPPVRNYICGPRFEVCDREIRQEAVAMLKKIDEAMSERLFSEDLAVGQDLFDYAAARLRKYEFLRQLTATVADDVAMIGLKAEWDRALEEAYLLPEAERPDRLTANAAGMQSAMQRAGLPDEQARLTLPLWERLAEATLRVDGTGAGRVAVAFECEVVQANSEASRLACRIMEAAEWALMVKPADEELARRHFLAAWEALELHAAPRTAATR